LRGMGFRGNSSLLASDSIASEAVRSFVSDGTTLYGRTGDRLTQPDLKSTKYRVDVELYRI
jgi:hypothetical protein